MQDLEADPAQDQVVDLVVDLVQGLEPDQELDQVQDLAVDQADPEGLEVQAGLDARGNLGTALGD